MHEVVVPAAHGRQRPSTRFIPIWTLAHSLLQLVESQESLVVYAREQRLQRGKRLGQKAKSSVPVRLFEQFTAKPFCLSPVCNLVDRRILARGTTQGRALGMQDD
ncbi:MAG: hypothetical protein F4171_02925 [Gammaproteobacteria bacterium]|nr:hypothetical protein [Gammaproteobacteria bacterium]